MTNNTSPELEQILDWFTEPGQGEKYLKDLQADIEQWHQQQTIAVLEWLRKQVVPALKAGVDVVTVATIDNEIAKLEQHEGGDE